jgi:hypothetical protein
MPMTLKNEINAELLQFFRQGQGAMSDDGTVRATVATMAVVPPPARRTSAGAALASRAGDGGSASAIIAEFA